jgi:hypothetical protein
MIVTDRADASFTVANDDLKGWRRTRSGGGLRADTAPGRESSAPHRSCMQRNSWLDSGFSPSTTDRPPSKKVGGERSRRQPVAARQHAHAQIREK